MKGPSPGPGIQQVFSNRCLIPFPSSVWEVCCKPALSARAEKTEVGQGWKGAPTKHTHTPSHQATG